MLDRTEIRQKVVALLKDKTSVGERVYDSKITSYDAEELPAISVVTPSQRGTSPAASQVPTFNTFLTLNIEVTVAITDDWAEALDNICEEIEEKVLKNPDFLPKFTQIQGYTTTLAYKPDGEMPIVSAVMSFDVGFDLIFNPVYPDDFNQTNVDLKVSETVAPIRLEIKLDQGGNPNAEN